MRGGKRVNSGRPMIDDKRKPRAMAFNDTEWALITARAKERGLSIRAYLLSLVEKDNVE